ncbi:methyltransferase [Saccharothrix obliqua]|uniref:methyltransferase n=1 Tax=Saccharothrix obliqua TaxID=2861747 RepID=UPI001C5EF48F|nr:methyltransferase [Saccharothrix obliqua]MBW4722341.1 methyltransferase [Saccharothrix obliqua]
MSTNAGRSLREMAGLATPMSLRVAATLELADAAGTTGATARALADKAGVAEEPLRRVLDHLVTIGAFAREGDRYVATPEGRQLSRDDPSGIWPMLDINSAIGRAELALVELLPAVVDESSAYARRYGQDFWRDLAERSELRESFDRTMAVRFRDFAPQISTRYDWSRFPTVVDVGGGAATLLVEILRAHPAVTGRLVELAPTAEAATEALAAAGLADRAEAVSGSFFDPLPTGADAYVLSDILHNWNAAKAREILAGCARAAGPGGHVIVVEQLREEAADTAIDLFMLSTFGGRERTSAELAELAEPCGLVLRDTVQVADARTLLEFEVAG